MTLTPEIFTIISIFLIVEILSQLFKLEALGKIFVQFYVVLMHLFVVAVLVNYETRDMVYYFVSLVAIVNTLRYLFYKIPAFNHHGASRLFLDLIIISVLAFLLVALSQYFSLQTPLTNLSYNTMLFFLISLGLILLYEMWQKALGVGLDIRNYLPDTFFSFFLVTVFTFTFALAGVGLFFLEPHYIDMIITGTPFLLIAIVLIMMFITKYKTDAIEKYSILYVIPTLFVFIQFVSIFIS